VAGCGLQKAPPVTVLTTQDFIIDPATAPTQAQQHAPSAIVTPPADPAPAPSTAVKPTISSAAASEGVLNVTAQTGFPLGDASSPPIEDAVLIDAKVGEINGKPVRADDVLGPGGVGAFLEAKARTRELSPADWARYVGTPYEKHTLTRNDWRDLATRVIRDSLEARLADQLLAEEARSSLKPEEKQGLKYLIQEAAENERREAGGSRAAAQRRREEQTNGPKTEQEAIETAETTLLIDYQLHAKLAKRVQTTWKDVRLYYERNSEVYNPPARARFRLIQVPAAEEDRIEKIEAALQQGKPFADVASMPENDFNSDEGGATLPQILSEPYETMRFLSSDTATDAAHTLKPGEYTHTPFDMDTSRGKKKAWLFLEAIDQGARPLSDADVQLSIARALHEAAFQAQLRAYLEHLKERASFTDVNIMAQRLTEIAMERYWPKE
jgi:hypothetical protein